MSDNQEKLSENDFKDPYEFGFETDIESDFAPKGLNEDVIRFISNKKNEPSWLTRLEARRLYKRWLNNGLSLIGLALGTHQLITKTHITIQHPKDSEKLESLRRC